MNTWLIPTNLIPIDPWNRKRTATLSNVFEKETPAHNSPLGRQAPFWDVLDALGTDWGLDELWCGAAAEYAAEISGSEQKLMKSERVCEVLRRQHGGAYPVALNSGTRPVVCRALADALGKSKYEKLCAAGSSPKPDVPAPRADPAAAPCRVDSAELRL